MQWTHILPSEISIRKGEEYDVLCDDGYHYICEVEEVKKKRNKQQEVSLHFKNWSTRYDYTGDPCELYIAHRGTYSLPAGLNPKLNRLFFRRNIHFTYFLPL